jgi:hypothetical protein
MEIRHKLVLEPASKMEGVLRFLKQALVKILQFACKKTGLQATISENDLKWTYQNRTPSSAAGSLTTPD